MIRTFRIAMFAGIAGFAAPAFADTCRTQTLPTLVQDLARFDETKDRAIYLQLGEAEMDCPNDPWVRTLLARAEMVAFEQLESPSKPPNQLDPANFAYVERAAAHLQALPDGVPDQVRVGARLLNYTLWSESMSKTFQNMLRYADAGKVHPMITDATPISCGFYSGAVASAAWNHQSRNIRSEAALKLMDRTIPACRTSGDRTRTNPLAQRAHMILRRISHGAVTDPEQIRRELASAARDVEIFRDGREAPTGIWFASHETDLQNLLKRHSVDLAAEAEAATQRERVAALNAVPPAPRDLWFTREHIGSDAVLHAIAISMAEQWSPLAAGTTDASREDVAQARVVLSRHVSALRDEAKEKGVFDLARPVLEAALTAFQDGFVRTPETQDIPGAPDWLYRTSIGLLDR